MGWTNLAIDILLFFFVIVSVLMCLVVLMQRSKQEGLGAAFGSGMMSDTFGAQTSAVLVKTTVWLAALFFILSISLARLYSHRAALQERGSIVQQELMKPVAPLSTNAAPATEVVPAVPATTGTTATVAPSVTPTAPAKPATK